MSTRATYQIHETTFYCHMDGYPTGAAQRFAAMIAAMTVPSTERGYDPIEQRRGGFEYAFIRGVMDAEPTRNHQEHGDTEFRYTLSMTTEGLVIRVQARGQGPYDATIWPTIYGGGLVEWVNSMRPKHVAQVQAYYEKTKQPIPPAEEILADFPEVVECVTDDGWGHVNRYYATKANGEAIKALEEAAAAKYTEGNPNKPIALKRAEAWGKAVAA